MCKKGDVFETSISACILSSLQLIKSTQDQANIGPTHDLDSCHHNLLIDNVSQWIVERINSGAIENVTKYHTKAFAGWSHQFEGMQCIIDGERLGISYPCIDKDLSLSKF
jgi:hypothetical protein